MDKYYWLDTSYYYGDFSVPKLALIRGCIDEDGEKDRNSEEVIAWATYEDIGISVSDNDCCDSYNTDKAIYNWIVSELGFVPDYEVN